MGPTPPCAVKKDSLTVQTEPSGHTIAWKGKKNI
ncbi:uncharacterized protein G2W53_027962 [Senna tora]|uniref:Uncharacterized protein n=1 Tax=Senna tora TaxID=362788 RepID=A0A834WA28_9FABA|nr:uncharacterized protein G2W53_027962 [Senna tora]